MAKRLVLRLLLRHWLALVLGCLVFLFLYLRLEPRPLRHVLIDLSSVPRIDESIREMRDIVLSSDGKLACIRTKSRHAYLLRLDTSEMVDVRLAGVDQATFDDNGELVLVTSERVRPRQFVHELIRYQPQTFNVRVVQKVNVTFEQKLPDDTYDANFAGIQDLGLTRKLTALLSPDGKIMLMPVVRNNHAELAILNTTDASIITILAVPMVDLMRPYAPYFEAVFSADSRTLLLQHSEKLENATCYRLRWLEVETGKLLGSRLLAEYSRMVEPCAVGRDTTCGRIMSSTPYTTILTSNGEVERQLILEDIPDPLERNRLVVLGPDLKVLAYQWENSETSKIQLSVRRIDDARLVYQRQLGTSSGAAPGMAQNEYSIETVLPGGLVVTAAHETTPSDLLEQWILKAKSLLDMSGDYPQTSLTFIDAVAGRVRGKLRLPMASMLTRHLPDLGILCICYIDSIYLHVLIYDNTLPKPVLKILLAATLSTFGLALLLEFSCLCVMLVRKCCSVFLRKKAHCSGSKVMVGDRG